VKKNYFFYILKFICSGARDNGTANKVGVEALGGWQYNKICSSLHSLVLSRQIYDV